MTGRQRAILLRLVSDAATAETDRANRMAARPEGSHRPEAIEDARESAAELWRLWAAVDAETASLVRQP